MKYERNALIKKKKYKTLWERLFDVDVLGVFEVFYVKGRASSAQQ